MIGTRRSRRPVAAVALGIALAGGLVGTGRAEDPSASLSASFRRAAARARDSLVAIRATDGLGSWAPLMLSRPGGRISPDPAVPPFPPPSGPVEWPVRPPFSGLVVDPDKGWILTAEPPTQGSSRFVVTFPDGRERSTGEVRRDARSGLALLAVDMRDLPHPHPNWGNPSRLQPGDWLIALGRPGAGDPSMSVGVFGARRRASGGDWLETDAAIGRIGGGGVLVNLDGEVVGICQPTRRRPDGSEQMGHAVPADRARRVAEDLGRFGQVRRAHLGIIVEPVDPVVPRRGLRVDSVRPGSPAAEARIEVGDVILAEGGRAMEGVASLQDAVESAPIGEELTLSVDRQGHKLEIKVRTRAMPGPIGVTRPPRPGAGLTPDAPPGPPGP